MRRRLLAALAAAWVGFAIRDGHGVWLVIDLAGFACYLAWAIEGN